MKKVDEELIYSQNLIHRKSFQTFQYILPSENLSYSQFSSHQYFSTSNNSPMYMLKIFYFKKYSFTSMHLLLSFHMKKFSRIIFNVCMLMIHSCMLNKLFIQLQFLHKRAHRMDSLFFCAVDVRRKLS